MDKITKIFRNLVLPIYWAILTYMLLKPGEENKEYWFMFSGIDKILHLSIFMLLGFSFKTAFPRIKILVFFQIMLCYALLTEILQDEMQLGRSLESYDVIADIVGVLIGYYIYNKVKTIFS